MEPNAGGLPLILEGTLLRPMSTLKPLDLVDAAIVHALGTGHFKCACGERLMFGTEPGALTLLIEQRQEHGRRMGTCPRCGRVHEVPLGSAQKKR